MTAPLELPPRRRLVANFGDKNRPWSLSVLDGPPEGPPPWEADIRFLFCEGDIPEARTVLAELPATCDGELRERWRRALEPARIIGTSSATGGTRASFEWEAREGRLYPGRWVFVRRDEDDPDRGVLVDSDADARALYARHEDVDTSDWTLIWIPPEEDWPTMRRR